LIFGKYFIANQHDQISEYFIQVKNNKKLLIMKKNMGSTDKIIRLIIAAIILVLFLTDVITGTVAIVLLVLAAVLVLTSLVSFCPLYVPLGLKTCPRKEKE
jgi:uncharacterized membrane protein